MSSRSIIVFLVFSTTVLFLYCSRDETTSEMNDVYLGQNSPGMTPEIFAPGLISTGKAEQNGIFDPSGREFFFTIVSNRQYVSFRMIRTENNWTEPDTAFFYKDLNGGEPFISPDGKNLFFVDFKIVDGKPDRDIFVCTRTGDTWGKPTGLDPPVNSGSVEGYPTVSENGDLFFYSNRDGTLGGFDIFVSKHENGNYTEPENAGPGINSEAHEFNPCISPDGTFVIFNSPNHPDGLGGQDLYISFRDDMGDWSEAVNMGNTFNSAASEYSAHITSNGKYILFSSTRKVSEPIDGQWGNGMPDIYWVDAGIVKRYKK